MKGRVTEIIKTQENMLDHLALLQMNERSQNLKFCGVPEMEGGNLRGKLIRETAEEEVDYMITNAFRIKVNSPITRSEKSPGVCLVTLSSIDARNTIMKKSREEKWYIDGKPIVVYRDIANRLLNSVEPRFMNTSVYEFSVYERRGPIWNGLIHFPLLSMGKFASVYEQASGTNCTHDSVYERFGLSTPRTHLERINPLSITFNGKVRFSL